MRLLSDNRKWGWLLFISIMGVVACTSLEETYDEFTTGQETIYIGRPDTILTVSGFEKVRFSIIINADPKITSGEIRNFDSSISQLFDVVRSNAGKDTVNVDLDLSEGNYRFWVTLMDDAGNKSLEREVPVRVLGSNYMQTLAARKVLSVAYDKAEGDGTEGAVINLDKTFEGLREVRLHYPNSAGEQQTIVLGPLENRVRIHDFAGGEAFTLESVYEPTNPFLDFIAPEVIEDTLPPCNTLASASASVAELDLGLLESRQTTINSLSIESADCIDGPVMVSTTGSFKIATTPEGPFQSSLSLDDISSAVELHVEFLPNSSMDSIHRSAIVLSATNLPETTVAEVKGEEIGVLGGIQQHPVALRQEASSVFTDDVDIFQHGTSIGNLWDGGFNWPSAVHSAGGLPTPIGFFTVDLSENYNLAEISWMPRGDCCSNRSHKRYQYWGLPDGIDPQSAITTTEFNGKPENRTAWEQEMISKGWVSLGQYTKDMDDVNNAVSSGTLITDQINVVNYVRYIRVVVLETFEGSSSGTINFSELDFKVDLGGN